jgi:toxin ParE1/3/4
MARYRLSVRAAADVTGIADCTIERFGIEQARHYRDGLELCFERLAENPLLGRSAEELAANLRRHEHESHVAYYEPQDGSVLIVRVLYESMDAPRHF